MIREAWAIKDTHGLLTVLEGWTKKEMMGEIVEGEKVVKVEVREVKK